jgi:hypothetical protein
LTTVTVVATPAPAVVSLKLKVAPIRRVFASAAGPPSTYWALAPSIQNACR